MDPLVFFVVLASLYGVLYFFDRFFKVRSIVALEIFPNTYDQSLRAACTTRTMPSSRTPD